jgi:hypothetical protein
LIRVCALTAARDGDEATDAEVNSGDQVVLFCPTDAKTLVYYNGLGRGEVNDPPCDRVELITRLFCRTDLRDRHVGGDEMLVALIERFLDAVRVANRSLYI